MARKNKKLLRKVTKQMNEHLHITSNEASTEVGTTENPDPVTTIGETTAIETNSVETTAVETTAPETIITAAGTEIANSIDPSLSSKWPKLKEKVPDIFLHKPVDFAQHVHKLLSMGIKFKKPSLCRYYTKILCPTFNDHKALVQYFEKKKLAFNTFGNLAKRKVKIVIKGFPKDIDLNEVKSELKSVSIPVVRVHIMKLHKKMRDHSVLVLAVVPYNDEGKKLLQITKIMGHEVTMEPPRQKTKQCHRCQLWGHTQRYCHGEMKCVKCAGQHISKKCERDPYKEPPKCANCEGAHTANYRKCPCCPESIEHIQNQIQKHHRMPGPYRKTDLVTMENSDTLYKNIYYRSAIMNKISFTQ